MNSTGFRLGRHLLWMGVLALLLPLGVVFAALDGLAEVRAAHADSSQHRLALRQQQDADMQHDAIHADLLSVIFTAPEASPAEQRALEFDLAFHIARLKLDLAQLERLLPEGAEADALRPVAEDLRQYADQAWALQQQARHSPSQARAGLPTFERSFHALETSQAALTSGLSRVAERADARAHEQEGQAKQWTLAIAACMWLVLLALGFLMFRMTSSHGQLLSRLRHSRKELALSNEQLEAGQRVAHVGSWSLDPVTGRTERSAELMRILGLPPEEGALAGPDLVERCVHPDDRERMRSTRGEALASPDVTVSDFRIVRPDGAVRDVQARALATRDADGQVVRLSGTIQDLTDQRELERMKDGFVSLISHELRTPLTSIKGALGLLASGALGPLPDGAARMVEISAASTDRLSRLINDILDVDKMAAGKLSLELMPHAARDLLDTAYEEMRAMAAEAGVGLVITDADGIVLADRDRIVQTLTNLVSNAVKFSPQDSTVELSARNGGDAVCFAVTDHGRGIPADQLDAVFERFQQVEHADAHEKGGTGLGLAICQGLVTQHGGRIWVTSDLGQGTTFQFTIPRIGTTAQPGDPDALRSGTVLVCDDDPGLVEVVSTLLQAHGYRTLVAYDGRSVVDVARSEAPDVILLDLLMPGMSGAEAVNVLRADASTATIPVVVLSGFSRAEAARIRLAPDAVEGWLSKPPDTSAILSALNVALGRDTAPRIRVLGRTERATVDARDTAAAGVDSPVDVLVLDPSSAHASHTEIRDVLRHYTDAPAMPLVMFSATSEPDQPSGIGVLPEHLETGLLELLGDLVGRGRGADTGPS